MEDFTWLVLQECVFTSWCIWANKYDIYQPIFIEHVLCITSTELSDLASLVISSPFYQRGLKRLKHRPMSHKKWSRIQRQTVWLQGPWAKSMIPCGASFLLSPLRAKLGAYLSLSQRHALEQSPLDWHHQDSFLHTFPQPHPQPACVQTLTQLYDWHL